MSRIVIVSAVYPPEPVVSARMSHDLAEYLVQKGEDVTVLCPQPSRPLNADYEKYKSSKCLITRENGITIWRLPSFTAPESKLLSRARESFSFGRQVCRSMQEFRIKPDAVYVNSWPMPGQAIISRYLQRNGIPMILQIMDIYPESLVTKLPRFLRKLVTFPLECLDRYIARQATSIVVISESMQKTYKISRGISEDNIFIINSWQDESLYESMPTRRSGCRHYNIQDNLFTFTYLGNIGPVAGVDFLIRAFHEAALGDAQLLIIGDGSERSACIDLAKKLHAHNIRFINDSSADNVPLLLSMAHVCLLPLKEGAALSSIPSKLSAYMFSAKPVLAVVDLESDTACAINQAACGWVGRAEDRNWLINMFRMISLMREDVLKEFGQRGCEYGLANFTKKAGVEKLSNVILNGVHSTKAYFVS